MHVAPALSTTAAVTRLVALAILFAALAHGLDMAISSGLRRIPTSDFGVANRIVQGRIDAQILISGSSRALTHFDPRLIEAGTGMSVFNIGLNGSQTDLQLARLKSYLRHNDKPRLLIHNLDAFSFQVTRGDVYDPGQYLPYLDDEALYDALVRVHPQVWKSRYLPLYGYAVEDLRFTWMKGLMGLAGWYPNEDRVQGYMPRDRAWTGEFERYRSAHPQGVSIDMSPEGLRAMEALARLCQDEGILLLFVYSPEYSPMQAMTRNRVDIFDRFHALASTFDATLWDYSENALSSESRYFYNSQHLNRSGAEIFSADIASRLALELAGAGGRN